MSKLSLLTSQDYANVRPLFTLQCPNLPMVLAILEGIIPGEVWVDAKTTPKMALVLSPAPYGFLVGEMDADILTDINRILKSRPIIKLVYQPINNVDLNKYGFSISARYQLTQATNKSLRIFSAHAIKRREGLQQQVISPRAITNEQLFNRCLWHSLIAEIYGGVKNYLRNGFGFALWDETSQLVAAEAHAIVSRSQAEVVTITHENYRKQGFATSVCQLLLEEIVSRSLKPVWSCEQSNLASIKLANRLGLDEVKEYYFYTKESKDA